MLVIPFIIAVIAAVIFAIDYSRTKSLLAAGLTLLTVAWILTQTLTSGGNVTF